MLIGIAGKMKSGKSSLAQAISTKHNIPTLSFAESLRMEVAQAFFNKMSKTDARYLWSVLEEQDKTLTRPILQAWGEGRRTLHNQDYWVDRLMSYIRRKSIVSAVIDDVRHVNEAQMIINSGGLIIRLEASERLLLQRGATEYSLSHASEQFEPLDEYLLSQDAVVRISSDGITTLGIMNRIGSIVEAFVEEE